MERVAGPYLFRKKFWALLFIAVFVAACSIRRSLNPRWTPVAVAILGAAFIGGYHSQFHPAPVPMIDHFGYELSPQRKSPYLFERHPLVDSQGFSCTPQPWGAIGAVNLNTLTKIWEKPLGTMIESRNTGIRNFGGPIVTASGLVITAGAEDLWLRIFDSATGEELHKVPLPVPAVATPMTYTLDGRQYVLVAAGWPRRRHRAAGRFTHGLHGQLTFTWKESHAAPITRDTKMTPQSPRQRRQRILPRAA
jgi:quinoprotein glucose dehydrogenase